jgi:hypothetical protein
MVFLVLLKKFLILPLQSGTNIFLVLLRTWKILQNKMCEGLLEHPVYQFTQKMYLSGPKTGPPGIRPLA